MEDQAEDKKELLKELSWSLLSVAGVLFMFLILVFFLKFIFQIQFSTKIILLIVFWGISLLGFFYFVKKQKKISVINNLHFCYFVFELLILTIIVHYIGGARWVGIIFYSFFIIYGIFLLPKRKGLATIIITILFFTGLIFLEHIGVVAHHNPFGIQEYVKNFEFFITSVFISAGAFILLYLIADRFAGKTRNQNIKLINFKKKLLLANNELNSKIQEISEKTKEIEEKKKSVERFNELMVGRELKMMQLKEEIKRLKGE